MTDPYRDKEPCPNCLTKEAECAIYKERVEQLAKKSERVPFKWTTHRMLALAGAVLIAMPFPAAYIWSLAPVGIWQTAVSATLIAMCIVWVGFVFGVLVHADAN